MGTMPERLGKRVDGFGRSRNRHYFNKSEIEAAMLEAQAKASGGLLDE